MFKFLMKKNFMDGLDNMFLIIVSNIVLIAFTVGGYFAVSSLIGNLSIAIPVFALFVMLIFVSIFTIAESFQKIACFKTFEIKEIISDLSKSWKIGIQFGLTIAILFLLAFIAFPFYAQNKSIIGMALLMFLIWIFIILILSLQWFVPLQVNMHGGYKKTLKKCFLFFFDNPLFSFGFFIYSLVLFLLSVFLVFLAPTFSGVVLAQCNAVKLRMYKYDWMEENQEEIEKAKRRVHIPWAELIAEDKEQLGNRSFLDLIFPWR